MNKEIEANAINISAEELKEDINTKAVVVNDEEVSDISAGGAGYLDGLPEQLRYTKCPKCHEKMFDRRKSMCHCCGFKIGPKPKA